MSDLYFFTPDGSYIFDNVQFLVCYENVKECQSSFLFIFVDGSLNYEL